ncbi:MAG: hypothetical protein PF501_08620 [Salinisphaera sp.]|jgi:hypothetical protein|nr:hypothetical protein [Salinisphaera sp.]
MSSIKSGAGRCRRASTVFVGGLAVLAAGTAFAQGSTSDSSTMKPNQTFREKFMNQVVDGSQVHGRVGIYDFRRWHDLNQPYAGEAKTGDHYNVQGTNYGAQVGLVTGRIYGFSAGAEFVYESSFYGNNAAGTKLNCNLACGSSVSNITQGFLQFNAYGFQIRGGRQLLNTPLAGADQFTFLPRSFNGVSAVWRPLDTMSRMSQSQADATTGPQVTQRSASAPQNTINQTYETNQYMPMAMGAATMAKPEWQLFAAKINRYEGRGNASDFLPNNRYFTDVAGFWSVGTNFHNVTDSGQYMAQYYHYDFQQTESADYGEIGYMAPTIGSGDSGFAPYVRAQVVAAYNGNKDRIPQGINSQIYGLKIGVSTATFGFSIFGDFSPVHDGSFNHGQMLKPYTDLSGVIYTDTMNNGIQNFGPGYGVGARLDFTPTDNLSMYARYVQYQAKYGHSHDFYFNGGANNVIDASSFQGTEIRDQKSSGIGLGMTYDMGGISPQLAGLKIGDNLGITRFDNQPNFYDNRIRFYYEF